MTDFGAKTRAALFYLLPMLVFIGLRLAILDTSIDRLGHLGEGEIAHAALAADLASGAELRSIWDYQVVPFHGGTFLSTLLFVPWSWVFGLSYASLKGLALAYATAAMLLWMALLGRLSGPRAAGIFGWLYAFGPPVLTRMQLTLWGTHAELNALIALCLVVTAGWAGGGRLEQGTPGRERLRLGGVGVTLGLAVWFNYAALVFAGLQGMVVGRATWSGATGGAVRSGSDERRPHLSVLHPRLLAGPSHLVTLLAGVAVGLLPLLAGVLAGQGSIQVYGQGPAGLLEGAHERLLLLPRLLLLAPPLSPQMPPGVPWEIDPLQAFLHVALFGAAAIVVSLGQREARAHPLGDGDRRRRVLFSVIGAYPFVFLVAFAAVHLPFTSSTALAFGFCPRYAATLYPFLFAAAALVAGGGDAQRRAEEGAVDEGAVPRGADAAGVTGDAGRRGARKRVAHTVRGAVLVAVLIAVVAGARDNLRLIDGSSWGLAGRFDAVRLTGMGMWGVDRRSLEATERFLEAERGGRITPETARGVRAVMGQAWNDQDYWQVLRYRAYVGEGDIDDGPSPEQVRERVKAALSGAIQDGRNTPAFLEGIQRGARMALGEEEREPGRGQ